MTRDEWNYLLGYDPEQGVQTDDYGRPGAKGLCAWKELDGGTHKGLVILPDGTENPSEVLGSITKTSDLATHGAAFLPAAGYRFGTGVNNVGSYGYYWSSAPNEDYEDYAYRMYFDSGSVSTINYNRYLGYAVRLVR